MFEVIRDDNGEIISVEDSEDLADEVIGRMADDGIEGHWEWIEG